MKTVLFFMNNDNPAVSRLAVRGLSRYAKMRKWNVDAFVRTDVRREKKRLREVLRDLRPDGIVSSYTEGVQEVLPAGFPVAWLDVLPAKVPSGEPLVSHDSSRAVTLAVEELIRLGRTHFAAVGFQRSLPWSQKRIEAFRRAVRRSVRQATVSVFEPLSPPWEKVGFRREVVPWLRKLPKPCALFAVCDRVAVNVLSAAASLGLNVPDDLAVVGVDNDEELCQLASPTLTSVVSDWEKGGFLVGEALDRRMQDGHAPPLRATFGDLGIVRRASTSLGSSRVDPRIVEASVFIREHACEGIGVADVVSRMGCSRSLAELRYLQATGHSIFEEIRDTQFSQVLVLLARRDVPIGVIADMCGWKSPLSLRRYFEKRTKMTLGEWRRQNLG